MRKRAASVSSSMSSTCTGRESRSRRGRRASAPCAGSGSRRDRGALGALQARDQGAEEDSVEAQLARGGYLLQQARAHLEHRDDDVTGADGGGALGTLHVAGLAEAVPGIEGADALAVALHDAAAADQDVEAVVHLAFLDDLLARRVVLPAAGAQHFPDLGVRELVEELQPPQYPELLLPVDARVSLAQPLVHARELGGEVQAALAALLRILLHRLRHDRLELLGNVLAQRMDRRRGGVHDLVQQLLQVA